VSSPSERLVFKHYEDGDAIIPGGTLVTTRTSRTFKLKWAKHLFQTIDDLSLKYGILQV
jgi:hypothetical protein